MGDIGNMSDGVKRKHWWHKNLFHARFRPHRTHSANAADRSNGVVASDDTSIAGSDTDSRVSMTLSADAARSLLGANPYCTVPKQTLLRRLPPLWLAFDADLSNSWWAISECLRFFLYKNPLLSENKEQIYSQFIKSHRCYDLIPTSTKLVVFDTELSVKKAFFALVYNSVRAAPLWESKIQQFVGMLTITDFITILHKYYKSGEDDIKGLEEHRICSWREELGKSGKIQPLCTVDVTASLMEAVRLLCDRKVHRLPVVDVTTGNVLYILTHKRILRFLYLYISDLPQPSFMSKSPKELGIGTWSNIHTVKKDTKLIEALRKFLELRVSALPVIDDDNRVVDIYAKFDVINLAADKAYNNLDVTVQEALKHRSAWFEGVHSCKVSDSMSVFIDTLVKSEVHRLVVTDDENHVQGVVSLSDILAFIVLHPEAVAPSSRDTNAGIAEHDEAMEIVN
ncbi:SNF4:AMP activated protein kinase gamma subunit [Trichuris trichiura]|uniref:SNF4:AMP activated protein kinase gamma subunit n=1 Tax=Trichuris trichiura TaxID=36087 RepID=A0A077Z319_TRITR|nr:SNF4:AMP activated protein kinase gamma subunit [Trichuris trichiura]